ncbi:DUF4861 family protein [Pseudotamlana carrageenivorans]|uniref:DUF4861 domain-containing protein n=1 Tax=Pseudotamlana carrageenivorans TaxID=2069432 RepID=A0A2I7SEK7_9FLAO|nr:DUF4861 family protein [Tamlana carrageenivorans]AUS04341.1 DUF4861 domain-containing protein [Tamlana carrageenivorans]
MKKLAILSIAFLSLYACKDNQTKTETSTAVEVVKENNKAPKTYAEISIAQGGKWVDGPRSHQEYSGSTSFKNVDELQVPEEHTDHTWYIRYEGPGWENSQVGYRLYLDWRNAIDIFGKKVDTMVLPEVGQDGFDSYHEASAWGQDILKAGKSMGIGGYGRIVADTIVHFQNVKDTHAAISNTDSESAITISYKDWKTGDDSIDLKSVLSIYPEDRFTKAELTPSKEIEGLCTGIVIAKGIPVTKKVGKKWAYIATYGVQTLASPPDNLGMALFYKLEEVAEQKEGQHDHLVIFKPTTKTVTYYFLGAWEQEPNGIKTEEAFIADLNNKLATLDQTDAIN